MRVYTGIILLELLVALTALTALWYAVMQVQIACMREIENACERIRLLAVAHRAIGLIQSGASPAGNKRSIDRDGYVLTVDEFRDESIFSVRWVMVRACRNGISVQLTTAIRRAS